jgi:hypothetical protein
MGEKLAKVSLMLTRPELADPDPTIPAKMGITTNMIARARSAKSGTIMSTRLF